MDISVQTGGVVPVWGVEEGYKMIREAGFSAVDWNINSSWNREKIKQKQLDHCIFEDSMEEIMAHYAKELEIMRKNGLTPIQAHAPFPAYVKGFEGFTDYAIGIYKKVIQFSALVGIKYLVIHGVSLALDDHTQTPETIHQMNLHLFESLIPELQQNDVVVCLENLFTNYRGNIIEGTCTNAEEAVWYIDHLNAKAGKECFGLCLDSGHLNLLGKNQGTYVRTLGKRIKALHLHDNHGTKDEHLAPYTGTIIWKDLIGALHEVGYEGPVNFETFQQVAPERVDPEMVQFWLNLIASIGKEFCKTITGQTV